MSNKISLFSLRLATILMAVFLGLRITTVANAASVDPSPSASYSPTHSYDNGVGGDVWQILAPIQNLASFFIRICIGLVGIAVAVGTYKNAAIANVAHTLSMSHPAAGAIFNIFIGIGYFMLFWILPGLIQVIYGQVVTAQAVNNMTNLDWLRNVGSGTVVPTAIP